MNSTNNRAIVFALDNDEIPFRVCWKSLIDTRSIPHGTTIFLLHSHNFRLDLKNKLDSIITRDGYKPVLINAEQKMPTDLNYVISDHISLATYFRLFFHLILPSSVSSILYLDLDMVALKSIKELFYVSLLKPIAAVDHLSPKNQIRLHGPAGGTYFQAGLLLMDLDYFRQNSYVERIRHIFDNEQHLIRWWDQDVLNIIFKDNWQRLSVDFNYDRIIEKQLNCSGTETISILHFSSRQAVIYPSRLNDIYWYKYYLREFGVTFFVLTRAFNFGPIIVLLFKGKVSTVLKTFRIFIKTLPYLLR